MNARRLALAAVAAAPAAWVAGWCLIAVNLDTITRWHHHRSRR